MKPTHILKTILFTFLAFQFISCQKDDSTGGGTPAATGELRATIDGVSFVSSAEAKITASGTLTIKGEKSNGEKLELMIQNAAEGEFQIGESAMGSYTISDADPMPYITLTNGKIIIESLRTTDSIVKGTFSFKASRMVIGDDGMPVMNNGTFQMEDVNVTQGSFNLENLIAVSDNGDPGDPGDPGDDEPDHEFFAKVENKNFVPTKVKVLDTTIARIPMFRIQAKTEGREMMRIDVPQDLGVGVHQMVKISNGTQLIGIYKPESGISLASSPGTLEITEVDLEQGIMKAKFSFTAVDPLGQSTANVKIRDGRFTIYFEGTAGANNSFKAKVDGSDYLPEAVIVEREVMNQYPRLIMKTEDRGQGMEIQFPETVRVGTYDMVTEATRGNEIIGKYVPQVGTSITYYSTSGTFTITEINRQTGEVSGEFKFQAVDASGQDPTEYEITEGTFNVTIP